MKNGVGYSERTVSFYCKNKSMGQNNFALENLQCTDFIAMYLSFEILNNNSIVHYSVLHIGMRGNNNVCRIALELGPY